MHVRSRHVELRLPAPSARRWHLDLAERLEALPGVEVSIALTQPRGPGSDGAHDRVLAAERLLHGLRPRLAARVDRSELRRWLHTTESPALVLDPERADETPDAWQLTFDGRPGTPGALAALAQRRFPLAELTRSGEHGKETVAVGRPGSELPGVLTAALEDVLAGGLLLVEQAVAGNPMTMVRSQPPGPSSGPPSASTPRPASPSLARTVASAGLHRAYRLAYRAPHWRVGWRLLPGADSPDVLDLLDHPAQGWSTLPDDGTHFYADPFPVAYQDHHVLFVEDFDHRAGKGVVSAVEFDDRGPVGRPRPVLRHESHLSYPYVLHDDGSWWMIPETSGAGTVELYRATDFPDHWRLEAVLLSGLAASDVSVVRHQDRWWMFATVRHGGAWSDALHLWSAEQLTGPWHPHRRNPVLLDIASARPAGRPVVRDGRLLRPVQDGTTGYGGGLAIAEVTRLDDDVFEQHLVGRLDPGARWPGSRLHTLNRAGRLECIDGSARSPRLWRRPVERPVS